MKALNKRSVTTDLNAGAVKGEGRFKAWGRAQGAMLGFGDKPGGEGVGGLPEPGAAGAGERAAPY